MSLVLSPHCSMSTTTSARTTPKIEPVHLLPRIRPPPVAYHVQERKRSPKDGSSPDRIKPQDSLIDPFLAQYIKPSSSDHHELYFKSLNKQVRIKSFDYYQKYLNVNKTNDAPNLYLLKQDLVERRKVPSPLLKVADLDDDISEDEPEALNRRRRLPLEAPSEAPSKKLHPQVLTKTLPAEFMNCPIDDLISLIYRMLQSLINLNDRLVPESIANPAFADAPMSPEQKKKLLTRYHSRTPPAISIETYLSRLTKFNNFTQATLLTTIYYIDLLSHNYQPYFTLNSWTVHRFLLVATLVAQKSLEDFFYTNDHYAKVGGVALTELNCLELDFLNRVDWKLIPAKQMPNNKTSIKYYKQVLDLYYSQLIRLMGSSVSEQNNVVYSMEHELGTHED